MQPTIAFLLSSALLLNAAYCQGLPARAADEGAEAELKVGVYYYPWYRSQRPDGTEGENRGWMSRALRGRLVPRQMPKLGVYDSRDAAVIADHIAQSLRANVSFWAVSWWGPGHRTDGTFRQHILRHPDCSKLKYAVLYEATGRLGSFNRPSYDHLLPDFAYLQEHYFDNDSYLHLDGKPVVFLYLTRVYFRGRGQEALAKLRAEFPNLFLIGDEVFGPTYRQKDAVPWDAITAYDVYGQSLQIDGATRKAIERLKRNYTQARDAARLSGTALVPAISPGYNDRAVRGGHPGRGRYFVDEEDSREGDIFREMLAEIAIPMADPRAERMVMVTSFNEWYEDTQIEATSGLAGTTSADDSPSGVHYADGYRYEDYGDLYLEMLRQMSAGVAKSR